MAKNLQGKAAKCYIEITIPYTFFIRATKQISLQDRKLNEVKEIPIKVPLQNIAFMQLLTTPGEKITIPITIVIITFFFKKVYFTETKSCDV